MKKTLRGYDSINNDNSTSEFIYNLGHIEQLKCEKTYSFLIPHHSKLYLGMPSNKTNGLNNYSIIAQTTNVYISFNDFPITNESSTNISFTDFNSDEQLKIPHGKYLVVGKDAKTYIKKNCDNTKPFKSQTNEFVSISKIQLNGYSLLRLINSDGKILLTMYGDGYLDFSGSQLLTSSIADCNIVDIVSPKTLMLLHENTEINNVNININPLPFIQMIISKWNISIKVILLLIVWILFIYIGIKLSRLIH